MAKTLKDFLNERQLRPMVVKNPDEQKFIDKHVVAKTADRNGNDDEVFKGSKVKMADRPKHRKGYNPGQDEEVYEGLSESTYEFDVSGEHGNAAVDKLVKHANSNGIKAKVHTYDGPGGGNPVIHLSHKDPKVVHSYAKKHIDPDVDLSDHKINEALKGAQHKIDANKNGKVDAHDFHLLRKKKKVAEEAEELDELSKKTLDSYTSKASGDLGFTHGIAKNHRYAQDQGGAGRKPEHKAMDNNRLRKRASGLVNSLKRLAKEEADQIDELSEPTVRTYYNKAGEQGKKIADKMKMGGGDWSKDGSDTKTLKKRAAGRTMALKRRSGEMKMSEDSEQIDELSKKTLGSYVVKSLVPSSEKSVSNLASKGGYKLGQAHDDDYTAGEKEDAKAAKRSLGVLTAVRKMTKEDAEQIDEILDTPEKAADYKAKAQKSFSKNIWKGGEKAVRTTTKRLYGLSHPKVAEEVEIEEKLDMKKASMGTVVKDFQKSDAPQFMGKSQKKRQVMAIAAKLSAERGGKPLNKEERLLAKLADISETHKRTMVSVFEKLNEDNQYAFMQACDTADGIEQMLDFSISYRGE